MCLVVLEKWLKRKLTFLENKSISHQAKKQKSKDNFLTHFKVAIKYKKMSYLENI